MLRPPITDINEECRHVNRNREWLLVFCKELNRQGYFLPVNMVADNPTVLNPILIDRDHEVQNVLKSAFIDSWLMVLDNNIMGDGAGLVRIFRIVDEEDKLGLECELTIDALKLGVPPETRINGFELTRLSNVTYRAYFTLSRFGLATCRMHFTTTV